MMMISDNDHEKYGAGARMTMTLRMTLKVTSDCGFYYNIAS